MGMRTGKAAAIIKPSDFKNVFAWCIIPYDIKKRNAQQRAFMLKRLGLSRFAFDWRDEHLDSFANEFKTVTQHKLHLEAAWFWIDSLYCESQITQKHLNLMHALAKQHIACDYWLCFDNTLFNSLSDTEKLDKACRTIALFAQKAAKIGRRVGLYNHCDWFGNPKNLLKIIDRLEQKNVGIVFNFHHSHEILGIYYEAIAHMAPHLLAVNISGVSKNGEKILPIGKGEEEIRMFQALMQTGYNGPLGVIGHLENEDVEIVLTKNLKGLQKLIALSR